MNVIVVPKIVSANRKKNVIVPIRNMNVIVVPKIVSANRKKNVIVPIKNMNAIVAPKTVNVNRKRNVNAQKTTNVVGCAAMTASAMTTVVMASVNDGGAIFAENSILNFHNVYFYNNTANDYGGAVYLTNGEITLSNVVFENNSSNDGAGALFLKAVAANLSDVIFIGNETWGNGGAVQIRVNSFVTINHGRFENNEASYGGAVAQDGGTLTVTNSRLTQNEATYLYGGAFYLNGQSFHAINTLIADNKAWDSWSQPSRGGGLYLGNGHATLTNVTIAGNTAATAAGIYCTVTDGITMNNSIIAGNTATDTYSHNVDGLGEFFGSHNLIGVGDGIYGLINDVDGNIVGTFFQRISPRFYDADQADYRLTGESPAIKSYGQ